jgi:hypothetical protein
MKSQSLTILKAVARDGDLRLANALKLLSPVYNDHRDQYPLALLIENGFLGWTITHNPVPGAENMREYDLARTLHMNNIKDSNGECHYQGTDFRCGIPPEHCRVFLKAKGSLYLDELAEKKAERRFTIIIAVVSAILGALFTAWFTTLFPSPKTTETTPPPAQESSQRL